MSQGRGLRFPCNDRADEVNKLFIIWPFQHALCFKRNTIKTPEVAHTEEVSVC